MIILNERPPEITYDQYHEHLKKQREWLKHKRKGVNIEKNPKIKRKRK